MAVINLRKSPEKNQDFFYVLYNISTPTSLESVQSCTYKLHHFMHLIFFPFIQEIDHTYYYVLHSTDLSITFES